VKVGILKISVSDAGALKVSLAKIYSREVSVAEINKNIRIFLSPLVPDLTALL